MTDSSNFCGYGTQDLLKQYNMFAKSLNYIVNSNDKIDICVQMDKLEQEIIELTNASYEEKYRVLQGRTVLFLDEEKNKLENLISLVTNRIDYIKESLEKHQKLTGNSLVLPPVLGEDKLEEYVTTVNIIDKYNKNLKVHAALVEEIKSLDKKIKGARDRIHHNSTLNRQYEEKLISLFDKALNVIKAQELRERSKEIELAYQELGFSLEKAKENVKKAKLSHSSSLIVECDGMLSSITLEYENYKEKKCILDLSEIYNKDVSEYDELVSKWEEIDSILKNIVGSEFYNLVNEDFSKNYTAIKLEQQDLDTYDSLCEEKNRKSKMIKDIEEENNSKEFKKYLDTLLKNEKKRRDEMYLEQQKKEYAERQKKLLRDKELQEERNRRQKLIEEQRNKEIEERTKQLLEEKMKTKEVNVAEIKSRMEAPQDLEESKAVEEKEIVKEVPRVSNERGIPIIRNDANKNEQVDFFNENEKQILESSGDVVSSKESWF